MHYCIVSFSSSSCSTAVGTEVQHCAVHGMQCRMPCNIHTSYDTETEHVVFLASSDFEIMCRSAYSGHLLQWLAHHNNCGNSWHGNYAADVVFSPSPFISVSLIWQINMMITIFSYSKQCCLHFRQCLDTDSNFSHFIFHILHVVHFALSHFAFYTRRAGNVCSIECG